jgi:hypothetical protein
MDKALRDEIRAKISIRIPGLKRSVGAGSVVEGLTGKLGVKPCSECEKRKARLNRAIRFETWSKEKG